MRLGGDEIESPVAIQVGQGKGVDRDFHRLLNHVLPPVESAP
jgi:hypothetical protein